MIKRYKHGNHIDTNSVVLDINISNDNSNIYTIDNNMIKIKLNDEDIVYGLGEQVRGINKRGWIYNSWCSDETDHYEDKNSLYGAHNFIIIHGDKNIGLFFDTTAKVTFDVGYSKLDELVVSMDELSLDLYIITNDTLIDIVKEFRTLIGRSYIAPLYAFGYQQSRWSYMDESEVLDVINKHKENDLPLECLYLDIDYMDNYKDFTINKDRFPNILELNNKLKKDNIHLIPIIDAGVKQEDGYFMHEEGIKNNYFVKDKDGNNFNAAVWPGLVYFPDFLRSDVRDWFGSKYKILTDLGFDGFWNDMNEPAMFYTAERLKESINKISELKDLDIKDMNLEVSSIVKGSAFSLQNNYEDYARMYHLINGKMINHTLVHNIYGTNMTRAAYQGLEKIDNNRHLLFSRASSIGAHRYGGIWTGDNKSIWSHIELLMHQLPALNMSGFIYTGSDLGGFGSNATEDLLLRWFSLSMFTPLMRNHACSGTRRQEVYEFTHIEWFRNFLKLRYALTPYLYSEYLKAIYDNDMMFKPLSFVYNDDVVKEVEDQLLVGDSIMIAPITKPNVNNRYVYLPEDMLMVKFRTIEDYDTRVLDRGHHYIECKLNEIVIFIRPHKMLVMTYYKESIEKLDMSNLNIISYKDSEYEYYLDDGINSNSKLEKYKIKTSVSDKKINMKIKSSR